MLPSKPLVSFPLVADHKETSQNDQIQLPDGVDGLTSLRNSEPPLGVQFLILFIAIYRAFVSIPLYTVLKSS